MTGHVMTRRALLRALAGAPLALRLPVARRRKGLYQAAYPRTY